MSLQLPREVPTTDDDLREQAERIIARWRESGFDTVLCYRSGYCAPANSDVLHGALPNGYASFAIDARGAIEALMNSIASGVAYRV